MFSPTRRRLHRQLDAVEDALEDVGNAIDGIAEKTAAEVFNAIQDALCTNGAGKTELVDFMGEQVNWLVGNATDFSLPSGEHMADMPDFKPTISSVFGCMCSTEWNLQQAAYTTLKDSIKEMIDSVTEVVEDKGDNLERLMEPIVSLIKGIKAAISAIMGAQGMCSSSCQGMFSSIFGLMLDIAKALAGVAMPAAAEAGLPPTTVSCICGMPFDQIMEQLFPVGAELSTVEAAIEAITDSLANIDSQTARDVAGELDAMKSGPVADATIILAERFGNMVDYMLGDMGLCSSSCKASQTHFKTIGFFAATRAVWPAEVKEWVPLASTSDLPTEAEIATFADDSTECMCSMTPKMGEMGKKIAYELEYNLDTDDMAKSAIDMAEEISPIMFSADASSYDCATDKCFAMVGSSGKAITRVMLRLMTNTWEDDGDGFTLVTPGMITEADINGILDDVPGCMCQPFSAGATLMPMLKHHLEVRRNRRKLDVEETIDDIARDVIASLKLCRSSNCRDLLDKVFAIIDKLSASDGTVTYNGASACTASAARDCFVGGACFPDVVGGSCAVCAAAPEGAPQSYPMAHFPDEADKAIYWAACSATHECPADPSTAGYVVSTTYAVAMSKAAFGAAEQQSFKEKFAETAAPGVGTADDVTLVITEADGSRLRRLLSSSIEVTASLVLTTVSGQSKAKQNLEQLDTYSATAALGVPVTSTGTVEVVEQSFAPPPSSPPPPEGSDGLSSAVIIGLAVGGGVLFLLLVLATSVFCMKRKGKSGEGKKVKPVA